MGFEYIRSFSGVLKIVEELFNIIAFSCVVGSGVSPRGDAFLAASIGAFIVTGVLLILSLLDLKEKISIPWPKAEFIYCLVFALFYLITASLVIDLAAYDPYIAGGSFGLFSMVCYIIDAYDNFTKF